MLTPVVMPKLGLTMQEGTVVEWRCAEGDSVRKGQVLLLIESEKVEFEVEAPVDGVIRALVTPEGETVPCRQVIAVLSETADESFDLARVLAEAGERAAQESRAARA
ncbi:MAG: lipoyl domain-containing protein, partial [Candidatus Bipolaricaulota bacterium]